jgi:hypothetical protein
VALFAHSAVALSFGAASPAVGPAHLPFSPGGPFLPLTSLTSLTNQCFQGFRRSSCPDNVSDVSDVSDGDKAAPAQTDGVTDISTCCRTSKANWRPRIYSTTNPGGIGHAWYRARFVAPFLEGREAETRFVPARVSDNLFNNPEYRRVLERLTGWQRRAWLDGDWDIAAGQFFTAFRRDVHVIDDFDDTRAREWFAALDYGFAHYTVFLLGCTDGDGNLFVVDEHAARLWLPERHAEAIKSLLARHIVLLPGFRLPRAERRLGLEDLKRIVAGTDVFSRQSDGTTIAAQYAREDITLRPANMDRVNGWAELRQRLGDSSVGLTPKLFIHRRCARLIETLPTLQHDPNKQEDLLKVDADDEGIGGDDAVDALRYLVATKPRELILGKLRGL